LVNALRTDTNECVRLEAAWALGRGCCCNKKTLDALSIAASGSESDKNPSEKSARAREASYNALMNCLACLASACPTLLEKGTDRPGLERLLPPPEQNPEDKTTNGTSKPTNERAAYYQRLESMPLAEVVANVQLRVANIRYVPQITMVASGPT